MLSREEKYSCQVCEAHVIDFYRSVKVNWTCSCLARSKTISYGNRIEKSLVYFRFSSTHGTHRWWSERRSTSQRVKCIDVIIVDQRKWCTSSLLGIDAVCFSSFHTFLFKLIVLHHWLLWFVLFCVSHRRKVNDVGRTKKTQNCHFVHYPYRLIFFCRSIRTCAARSMMRLLIGYLVSWEEVPMQK